VSKSPDCRTASSTFGVDEELHTKAVYLPASGVLMRKRCLLPGDPPAGIQRRKAPPPKTGSEIERVRMEGRVALIAPLVDQLRRFCRGHEEDDHGAAAGEMLAFLGDAWPDVPEVVLTPDQR
jgi:hypothetical protein